MSQPLPFSDVLDALRKQGFEIGLAQHQDVARLCERLGTELARDRRLLARSLAGLLARNHDEQVAIEKLFFQHYAPALVGDPELVSEQPDAVRKGLLGREVAKLQQEKPQRWRNVLLAILAMVTVLGGGLFAYWNLHKQPEPKPLIEDKTPLPGQLPVPPLPPPIAQATPDLGEPIHLFHWQTAAQVAVPLPLLLFAVLYSLRRRRDLQRFATRYWRAVRNDLGGIIEPQIDFAKLLPPALERGDLDDMATILGRSDDRPPSRELDGEKSVRITLTRGALPTLIFRQQPLARTVLVLCDVSSDMRLWQRKSEALCEGLTRRGVPLVIRYFDGDASRVTEKPFGRAQDLLQVQRQYPDAALLIVSSGVHAHDIEQPGQLAPWVELCEKRFRLRAWLHPVLNRELWRRTLRRKDFPMRVLPMSRKGLLAMAYDLAQEPERRRHIAHAEASPQRAATPDDAMQLKRLLTMWPEAPPELAEHLLHKFCPGLPEETLLHVWAASRDMSGQRLRFAGAELSRWLTELQESEKHLQTDAEIQQRMEERVRRELLRILRLHEPTTENQLEHMQWRLRCALQQLSLHDPDDCNVNEALATLRELAPGPLLEGVTEAMATVGVPLQPAPRGQATQMLAAPVRQRLQKEVLSLIRTTASGHVQVPSKQKGGLSKSLPQRPGWLHLPNLWELAPALLVLALCVLGVYKQGIGQETLEHVEAYRIQTNPFMGPASPQVGLEVSAQGTGFPEQVTLCGDTRCTLKLEELVLRDGRIEQQVKRQSEDRYYHVRARLPRGTWAYSKQILIPGYQPPPMGELLVRFISEGKTVGKVAFAVTDATGKSVTGEAEKSLTLRAGPVSIVGEVKPYPQFAQAAMIQRNRLSTVTIDLGRPPPPLGMVEILAGSFLMGSNDGDADEKPVHRVTLPTYYFDQYEVTMEQYQACVRAGGCTELAKTVVAEGLYSEEDVKKYSPLCNRNQRGRGRHPVNCVDWNQAAGYCKWAGKRLPTEEEWEYAARGTDGRKYPWGKEEPRPGLLNACGSECVEMAKNKGLGTFGSMYSGNDGWETTAPVGSVKGDRSPFGVMDLGGNVTEWVQDWYRDSHRTSDGPTKNRSLRGASWNNLYPSNARAPSRLRLSPVTRNFNVGFRCARTK